MANLHCCWFRTWPQCLQDCSWCCWVCYHSYYSCLLLPSKVDGVMLSILIYFEVHHLHIYMHSFIVANHPTIIDQLHNSWSMNVEPLITLRTAVMLEESKSGQRLLSTVDQASSKRERGNCCKMLQSHHKAIGHNVAWSLTYIIQLAITLKHHPNINPVKQWIKITFINHNEHLYLIHSCICCDGNSWWLKHPCGLLDYDEWWWSHLLLASSLGSNLDLVTGNRVVLHWSIPQTICVCYHSIH